MTSGTPYKEMETREQPQGSGKEDDGGSAVNMKPKFIQKYENYSNKPQMITNATDKDQKQDGDKVMQMTTAIKIGESKFGEEHFSKENKPIKSIQILPHDGSQRQTTKSYRMDPFQMTLLRQIAPSTTADFETHVNLQCLPLIATAGLQFGNLVPTGIIGGPLVYQLPPGSLLTVYAVPFPVNVPKNRRSEQDDDGRPYIKKPPNAFMLFMKEQRPNVVADLKITDNALVNVELGQRWKSLPQLEKDKYIQEAERMRTLHEKQYPEWSSKENYGKKRKRIRRRRRTLELQ